MRRQAARRRNTRARQLSKGLYIAIKSDRTPDEEDCRLFSPGSDEQALMDSLGGIIEIDEWPIAGHSRASVASKCACSKAMANVSSASSMPHAHNWGIDPLSGK